ncbi:MAG: UvrD-helicase domain-containing protein [Gammaproteobacteria bacterium]|nr:UvrD-helicase domain-containing protein [Gammaproteobacteria bacterium]
MKQPTDQAQRELAVDGNRSVIVQAPAGSGKTTLLVTRYLRLLARAQKPEEILAITFTIKSAGEMRTRILSALRNREPTAAGALARNEKMGWNLLEQPRRLKILTIDSFAMSVIRQLPLASGLYPYTRLLEEPGDLYLNATRQVLYKLYEDDPLGPTIAEFLALVDNDYAQAQRLIINMLARRDQWLDAVRELVSAHQRSPDALQAILSRGVDRLVDRAISELTSRLDNGQIETMDAIVRGVAAARKQNVEHAGARWRLLGETLTTQKGRFRRQLTRSDGFDPVNKKAKTRALSLIEDLQALHCEPLVENLRHLPDSRIPEDRLNELATICIVLAVAVVALNEEFKREEAADFNQLLLSARNALRNVDEPTELALALDYRIHHILVDEFQDTSVSQFEMFADLVEGWSEEQGNTFFAVGDPMQSIYRFRDADVSLFYKAWNEGIAGLPLEKIRLSSNFRACAPLVDWQNSSFIDVMGTIEDPLLGRVPYEKAVAARTDAHSGGVYIELYRDRADQVSGVIARITELIEAHPSAHIALLVRSRSHLATILPALRLARLRWRARDIDPLVEKPVVRDLLSLLSAIDNPKDRLAWMSVLRSPWVGLSLPDLEQFATVEDIYNAITENPPNLSGDGMLRTARLKTALLAGFPLIDQAPPRSVIEKIWIQCGGVDAYADPSAIEQAECLLDLIDAQGFDGLNPTAVLNAAQNLYANDSTEAQLEILTIHKSKGLEFDHVILPSMERVAARSDAPLLRWRPESPGLLIGARDTPGSYAWLAREDKAREAHELERLLYVACTRAKDSLHLFATVDERPAPSSLLALLWPQLKNTPLHTVGHQPQQTELFESRGYEKLPADYIWSPPHTVSELADVPRRGSESMADTLSGKAEVALGTVLNHTFYVQAEYGIPANMETFINKRRRYWREELRNGGVPETAHESLLAEIARQIRNLVEDEKGLWLLNQHPGAQSELPLTGNLEGELINVRLDRTFDFEGIRWVIDYKTANLDPAQSVELFIHNEKLRYLPQLERYRNIAAAAFGVPVRMSLYFSALPRFEVVP